MIKPNWISTLKKPPQISKRDIWLTLIPLIGFLIAFYSRPWVMDYECKVRPEECTRNQVNWLDQKSMGIENLTAEKWSNIFQNTAGAAAVLIPLALQMGKLALGAVSPAIALAAVGADFLMLLQATLWNAFINETVRLAVQRPRPFVYRDHITFGDNPTDYTSFYSGHTSFAAIAMVTLLMCLCARGAKKPWLWTASVSGLCIVFLTALTRVLAGRHFMSDVIFAAFAGSCIAYTVGVLHRGPKKGVLNV